jgi:hypothetical protein
MSGLAQPRRVLIPQGFPNRRQMTAILADAINLGLNRMADACHGTSLARLSWIADWHVCLASIRFPGVLPHPRMLPAD